MNEEDSKKINNIFDTLARRMFNSLPEDASEFVLYLMVAEDMTQSKPQIVDSEGCVQGLGSIAALRRFDPDRDINELAENLSVAWKEAHGESWTWIKLSIDHQGHFEAEPHYEKIELLEDILSN